MFFKTKFKGNKKLILIDSNSILYRGYHQPNIKNMKALDGITPVNGVFGFTRTLLNIQKYNPSNYIACVFDSVGNQYRKDIYKEYKSNRKKTEPELTIQFPICKKLIQLLGIELIEQEQFEGDDIISSYSNYYSKKGYKIMIVSTDKDLIQLMNENIQIYDPIKKIIITKEYILEKYEIEPYQILDYLSLVGDQADAIPGVKGIGSKTAIKILKEYKTIQILINELENINDEKLKNKIKKDLENLKISYQLVQLRNDAFIHPIERFEYKNFHPELFDYLKELKFYTIIDLLEKQTSLKYYL